MSFLANIEQLRSLEWARSYLWDLRFPEAPQPFDQWFPASDYSESRWEIQTHSFSAHYRGIEIPKSRGLRMARVTFYNDANFIVQDWINEWVEKEIFLDGLGVATLEEASKTMIVQRLLPDKTPQAQWTLSVIPKDGFNFDGGSVSSAIQSDVSFIIVNSRRDS